MSRMFDVLQHEGHDQYLFQRVAVAGVLPTDKTVPEEPILNDTISRGADLQLETTGVKEEQSSNGHGIDVTSVKRAPSSSWFTPIRQLVKGLGITPSGTHYNGNHNGHKNVRSMALQEEIKLVQRVFFSTGTGSNRIIVFSGVENGKTSGRICARAAETLATQVDASVCAVDSNPSSRSLHEYFGISNDLGLADVVLQNSSIREVAQRIGESKLWVIPCGAATEGSQLLLNPEGLRCWLEELRSQFDYVLINAPSASRFADSTLIGQLSDGVILVVEANASRRETTRRLVETLEAAKVPIRGVVLNNRTFPIPESVYRKL